MQTTLKRLTEDQIKTYHSTLSIATSRLTEKYRGRKMRMFPGESISALKRYEVINFYIIAVDADGGKASIKPNGLPNPATSTAIKDLTIMVRFDDDKGNENSTALNDFLEANNIREL